MRGFAAFLVLLAFLFSVSLLTSNPAFAVTMETVINPDSNSARLSYEELHTLTINYPAGSRIAKLFGSGTNRLVVTAATNDTQKDNREAMQSLLASVNDEFKKHSSVATAKYADIRVTTEIKPSSDVSAVLAQQVLMDVDIDNFVIPNDQDTAHKYIDYNWRSFTINDPLKIVYVDNSTQKKRSVEVNLMSDAIEGIAPGFLDAMKQAGAGKESMAFLQRPIIDFSKLSLPMDKWYVLFDAAASLRETEAYGYAGEANGAKVVTIYSLGEGSIREGAHTDTLYYDSFGPSKEYSMEFNVPPPNSRIDVLGYSNMHSSNGLDTSVISDKNEGGSSYAGNFPLVVLGSFGAIIAVIVGFVLIKSRTPKVEMDHNDKALHD